MAAVVLGAVMCTALSTLNLYLSFENEGWVKALNIFAAVGCGIAAAFNLWVAVIIS